MATGIVFDTRGGNFQTLQVTFSDHSYITTPMHAAARHSH